VGGAISIFQNKLYEYNSQGVGLMDLSVFNPWSDHLSFGANVKNINWISGKIPWQVKTDTDLNAVNEFSLPYETKAGACYKNVFKGTPFLVTVEEDLFSWKDEESGEWYWDHQEHAGVEAGLSPRFFVRTGYDNGRFPLGISVKNLITGKNSLHYVFSFERNGMGFNHNMEWVWQF
jgi:hypothetical protein